MIGLCQRCWSSGKILSLNKRAEPLCEECFEKEMSSH